MEILSLASGVIPKQNFMGTRSTEARHDPKSSNSKNTFQSDPVEEAVDLVSISEKAESLVTEKTEKLGGSFEINNHRINYSLTENNDLVVKIIDRNSNEVVRQLPPEEMIKIKEAISDILKQ